MLAILPYESRIYMSSNTFYESSDHPDIDDINPPKILRNLNIFGFPNHKILKVGTPVVFLRNLDPSLGLCKGTRLTIKQLGKSFFKHRSLPVEILNKRCLSCILTSRHQQMTRHLLSRKGNSQLN